MSQAHRIGIVAVVAIFKPYIICYIAALTITTIFWQSWADASDDNTALKLTEIWELDKWQQRLANGFFKGIACCKHKITRSVTSVLYFQNLSEKTCF